MKLKLDFRTSFVFGSIICFVLLLVLGFGAVGQAAGNEAGNEAAIPPAKHPDPPKSTVVLDLKAEPSHFSGTLTAEVPLRETTTLQIGVGFDGYLEDIDELNADVAVLSMAQEFRGGADRLRIGKAAHHLGRGRLGTLLSTGNPPGYPSIAYTLTGERYVYHKVLGDLAPIEPAADEQRYKRLGLHYLTYRLTPQLEVGAGEIFIRTEPFPGDFFYDLVPGLPYYLVKYNPGIASETDNNLIYLDAELDLGRWTSYGEFLVNEFPMPGQSNTPLYGFLVGVERGRWIAEYARLTNYAYSNGSNGSNGSAGTGTGGGGAGDAAGGGNAVYSYDGRPLGHWLGSDGDVLEIRWATPIQAGPLQPGWTLEVGAFAKRKGEGKLDSWSDAAEERRENAFLSGVVEKTVGMVGRVERDLGRLHLHAEVQGGRVFNEGHESGASGFAYKMNLGLTLVGMAE